jgi:hypothetical protein
VAGGAVAADGVGVCQGTGVPGGVEVGDGEVVSMMRNSRLVINHLHLEYYGLPIQVIIIRIVLLQPLSPKHNRRQCM